MKTFTYPEAKDLVQSICEAAKGGAYDTREKFMSMLAENPELASQGYTFSGELFFWNPASVRLYGHSESSAIGKNVFDLVIPPDFRKIAREATLMAYKTGQLLEAGSCDLIQSNGEAVTVFSGHLAFQWNKEVEPEFYCVDVAINPHSD